MKHRTGKFSWPLLSCLIASIWVTAVVIWTLVADGQFSSFSGYGISVEGTFLAALINGILLFIFVFSASVIFAFLAFSLIWALEISARIYFERFSIEKFVDFMSRVFVVSIPLPVLSASFFLYVLCDQNPQDRVFVEGAGHINYLGLTSFYCGNFLIFFGIVFLLFLVLGGLVQGVLIAGRRSLGVNTDSQRTGAWEPQ